MASGVGPPAPGRPFRASDRRDLAARASAVAMRCIEHGVPEGAAQTGRPRCPTCERSIRQVGERPLTKVAGGAPAPRANRMVQCRAGISLAPAGAREATVARCFGLDALRALAQSGQWDDFWATRPFAKMEGEISQAPDTNVRHTRVLREIFTEPQFGTIIWLGGNRIRNEVPRR